MLTVGIDTLALYTSRYQLDMAELAQARGVDVDKFNLGLGQLTMSVTPPGEDVVTMAANAALQVLDNIDPNEIEMLLFATESGIDQSKAAGIYVHHLLGLPERCRIVELKQACYSATAGLQLALPYLQANPDKKILLIASDVARYGLHTSGESSQGAGAVAMVLTANPRLLAIEPAFGVATNNVMDFWRPNYLNEALVEGKYSSKLYLSLLETTWSQYQTQSGRSIIDHSYYCYHTPVPRLVEKAHQFLLKLSGYDHLPEEVVQAQVQPALNYGRHIGNSYTASLYVGLASLFDHVQENIAGKRIGFYSYGSGCVAEYFSGVVQENYQSVLHTDYHRQLFSTRESINVPEYEALYQFEYVQDGSTQIIPCFQTGYFRLTELQQHKRIYERMSVQGLVSKTIAPAGAVVSAKARTHSTAQRGF